jgi:Recombination endonuclease VII/HNH endonuclease
VPYIKHLPIETLREFLKYDPETGSIVWVKRAAKNTIVGSEAGSVKGGSGANSMYRYIRLQKADFTAARAAWALHYGEWPSAKVFFVDGDITNIRISNLQLSNTLEQQHENKAAYMKAHRETFPEFWKNTHLQRQFGIGLAEYSQMVSDRGNKCDICGQPEKQERAGKVKALAVDHDHKTGAVRGLLCSDCNTALGKFHDSKDLLTSAIAYLTKHMVS